MLTFLKLTTTSITNSVVFIWLIVSNDLLLTRFDGSIESGISGSVNTEFAVNG